MEEGREEVRAAAEAKVRAVEAKARAEAKAAKADIRAARAEAKAAKADIRSVEAKARAAKTEGRSDFVLYLKSKGASVFEITETTGLSVEEVESFFQDAVQETRNQSQETS